MKIRFTAYMLVLICVVGVFFTAHAHAESPLLTPQENEWLHERKDTIVVYPEKNNPPYSYQSPSGIIEGLSIDYIELIAAQLDITVEYLTPRSISQVLDDVQTGKGDIVLTLAPSKANDQTFVFTEPYVTVPYVIVVRKDIPTHTTLTLADFNGKRVALTKGVVAEGYVRQNFPRIILQDVTDDEAALQQVVLGQVDAATMDVASLSYLLSKQVLSSVKAVGNLGYDYRPAFAMTKDKAILQSILEKGYAKITPAEREALAEKWIQLPNDAEQEKPVQLIERLQTAEGIVLLYALVVILLIGILVTLLRRRALPPHVSSTGGTGMALHAELRELEVANQALQQEIEEVKELEHDIEEKLKRLNE